MNFQNQKNVKKGGYWAGCSWWWRRWKEKLAKLEVMTRQSHGKSHDLSFKSKNFRFIVDPYDWITFTYKVYYSEYTTNKFKLQQKADAC